MVKRRIKRNKIAFWLAIVSAVFLFISGTTGVATWARIGSLVYDFFNSSFVRFLFIPILIIASLGAFSVLIGAVLARKRKVFAARMFILFGSGAGLIGFLFNLFLSAINLDISVGSYLSFSSLGIIFSLISQGFLKKKKSLLKKVVKKI